MRAILLIVFTLVLFVGSIANGDTINIPADYPSIQDGIDAAVTGDTVLVAPGTYEENIQFAGKAITVESSHGPEVTVIDGSDGSHPGWASVVSFYQGEGPDSILRGFTLTNGIGYWVSKGSPSYGGGIFCNNGSSPTIENNRIVQNQPAGNWFGYGGGIACDGDSSPHIIGNEIVGNVSSYGAGIWINESSPLIEENIIQNNSTEPGTFGGGGIYCSQSAATIRNNVISSNNASGSGGGIYCDWISHVNIDSNLISENTAGVVGFSNGSAGGIRIEGHTYARVTNNTICRNTTGSLSYPGFGGGGLSITTSSDAYVANNLIAENLAYRRGGGIYAFDHCELELVNNTIVGNTAHVEGGGFYCRIDVESDVANMIFWGNSAPLGDEIYLDSDKGGRSGVTFTIYYSDVEEGLNGVYKEPGVVLNWGPCMIDADPLFVDPAQNDFHLTYNSPCRNTGHNSSVTELFDLEGDPRIAWEGIVDMGKDEFYTHLYITGDPTPGGDIQGKFVGLPGTSPVSLIIGTDVWEDPVWTSYGDLWLTPPRIVIPLVPIPATGVLAIPTTIPLLHPAPYDIPMQGLVGLESDSLTNLYVLEVR